MSLLSYPLHAIDVKRIALGVSMDQVSVSRDAKWAVCWNDLKSDKPTLLLVDLIKQKIVARKQIDSYFSISAVVDSYGVYITCQNKLIKLSHQNLSVQESLYLPYVKTSLEDGLLRCGPNLIRTEDMRVVSSRVTLSTTRGLFQTVRRVQSQKLEWLWADRLPLDSAGRHMPHNFINPWGVPEQVGQFVVRRRYRDPDAVKDFDHRTHWPIKFATLESLPIRAVLSHQTVSGGWEAFINYYHLLDGKLVARKSLHPIEKPGYQGTLSPSQRMTMAADVIVHLNKDTLYVIRHGEKVKKCTQPPYILTQVEQIPILNRNSDPLDIQIHCNKPVKSFSVSKKAGVTIDAKSGVLKIDSSKLDVTHAKLFLRAESPEEARQYFYHYFGQRPEGVPCEISIYVQADNPDVYLGMQVIIVFMATVDDLPKQIKPTLDFLSEITDSDIKKMQQQKSEIKQSIYRHIRGQ